MLDDTITAAPELVPDNVESGQCAAIRTQQARLHGECLTHAKDLFGKARPRDHKVIRRLIRARAGRWDAGGKADKLIPEG